MNKRLIFFIVFAMATSCGFAQTSSGNMMIGGGLRIFSDSYQNGSSASSTTFSPGFGYFISDNLAVGTTLTISGARYGAGQNRTMMNSFALGPFARYYIFTSNQNFGFFGQAQLTIGAGRTDHATDGVFRNNSVSFSISPGAAYFFNEHWALELFIVGFEFVSTDPNTENDNDKRNTVELGLNSLTPGIGFRYHF
jgi:hypothetical protein